jgi:hypothetical protein
VVSFTPWPLYSNGKSPCYPLDRRPCGLRSSSGRGGEEKYSQVGGGGSGDNVFSNLVNKVIIIRSNLLEHSIEIEELNLALGFSHIFI